MKIEKTGDLGDNTFLYTHAILEENELDKIDDIKKEKNIDFISVRKKGKIDFLHVTSIENLSKIESSGLIMSNNIGDLGKGIYAVYANGLESINGIENLKDYLQEYYDYDSMITVVYGTYIGEYLECIYGHQHDGYVLLLNNVPAEDIEETEDIELEDFQYAF